MKLLLPFLEVCNRSNTDSVLITCLDFFQTVPVARRVHNSTVTSGTFGGLSSNTENPQTFDEEFPPSLSEINQDESEIESRHRDTGDLDEDNNDIGSTEMLTPQRYNDGPEEPRNASDDSVLRDLIREIWDETDVGTTETLQSHRETTKRNAPASSSHSHPAANINQDADSRLHVSRSLNRFKSMRGGTSTSRPSGSLNAVSSVPRLRGSLNGVSSEPRLRGSLNGVRSLPRLRGSFNGVNSVPRLRGSSARGRARGHMSPITNINQFFNDDDDGYDDDYNDIGNDRRGNINGSHARARNVTALTSNDTAADAPLDREIVQRDRTNLRNVSSKQIFKLNRAKLLSSFGIVRFSIEPG